MATVLTVEHDDDTATEITVRGLSRDEWTILRDAHPLDGHSFEAALVAACTDLAEQGWDPADVVEFEEWADPLIAACLERSAPPVNLDWARRRLAGDGRLTLEVDYCSAHGIPHSTFASWRDRDQDLALARWLQKNEPTCPGCGVPEADMQDPDAAHAVVLGCLHCRELEETREQAAAVGSLHGTPHVVLRSGPEPDEEA